MAGLLDGVLPYLFSRGDWAKRQLGGLLTDPMGTAEQSAGLLLDSANRQRGLLDTAFPDKQRPFKVADQQALEALIANTMNGPMGFAPAGVTVFRAGAPRGMTADAGGPTFYATEKRGAEPFSRNSPVKEYDISPKNVLDTQLIKNREIYEQFRKETGNPAGYGQSARPYWTAEHDFKKWLDAKGHKFDAVMFDEPTGVASYAIYGK
jgi:hypothetical protein